MKNTRFKIIENADKEFLYLYFRLGKIIDKNSTCGNNFTIELFIELKLEFPNMKELSPMGFIYNDISNLPVELEYIIIL